MVYLLLICWVLFIGIVFSHPYKSYNQDNLFLFLSFVPMTFIMGLRSVDVGIDTIEYAEIFEIVASESWNNLFEDFYYLGIEIGYALFMKCCSCISNDYYVFQFIFSLLYCLGFGIFIKNNMQHRFFGAILFLCFGTYLSAFNIARQMFAVMIVANSIYFLKQQKIVQAIIIMMIALTIHISSILFLIVPLCYVLQKSKLIYFVPFLLIIGFYLFEGALQLTSDLLVDYQSYYDNTANHRTTIGFSIIIYATITLLSVIAIYFSLNQETEQRLYAIFSLMYVGFVFMGTSINYIERLGLYFTPFVLLLFEYFIEFIGRKSKNKVASQIYALGITSFYIMYFCIGVARGEQYKFL